MARMKYLLDANVAIDYLNGLPKLAVLSERLRDAELYASVGARMELLSYHRLTFEDEPPRPCLFGRPERHPHRPRN
ncbi:MAG: hypothetical protein LBO66_12665 [Deltaproteobacteria bacterium]|nr:hypothetical protein [Deltaproteobacteria bacterium]